MSSWDIAFEKQLLSVKNYRDFLAMFFASKRVGTKPLRLSYRGFSDRAGYSSKSFISDVIAGRKRLTPASFDKTVLGLSLNKNWSEYFKCLVALEEDDFIIGKINREFYSRRRDELHHRLSSRKVLAQQKGLSPVLAVALKPYFPEVFASLGSIDEGATLEQIAQRTRLNIHRLPDILEEFKSAQLVEFVEDKKRYRPMLDAFEAHGLASSDHFERDFSRSIEKVKARFKTSVRSDTALFMTQTFSVNSGQLKQFRQELSRLINEFSDAAESAQGDAIAEICIGFTNNAK